MKEETFYKIPKSLMKATGYYSLENGKPVILTIAAKLVYTYMLDRLVFFVDKQKGQHFESQQTIADACGLEYKVVGKILRQFMDNGVVFGKKLRPNGRGQWRWHYTKIETSLDFWQGSPENPVKVGKDFVEHKAIIPAQTKKNLDNPPSWMDDDEGLPF